jgi:spectinomycin phosphotransferase
VRGPFERLDTRVITAALERAWGISADDLRYCPVGGGAYHWVATESDGRRWFVTCDDLDTKPWLGTNRDTVFANLLRAYGTAVDLRASGRSFVVAPTATREGVAAVRVDDRHSLAVFDHVEGEPQEWGRPVPLATLLELVEILAALHTTAPQTSAPLSRSFVVPGRAVFEEALGDLHRPWQAGPLSDVVRRELVEHVDTIWHWLDQLDRFASGAAIATADLVLTHGEPHPGNLIRHDGGLRLVDWDTVALAPRERDLWMIAEADPSAIEAYRKLAGRAPDPEALTAYRLLWTLADLASFTAQLRAEHHRSVDNERALVAAQRILSGDEPAPYGSVLT